MENKYLQERKEGFFSKIINFFKGWFIKDTKKQENIVETTNVVENKESKAEVNTTVKESIDIQKLVKDYEENSWQINFMNDEEVSRLNDYYKNEIEKIDKTLEDKKNQLEALRIKVNG